MSTARTAKARFAYAIALSLLLAWQFSVRADSSPQPLPFAQDWGNAALITAPNDWSGVPGIVAYNGAGLASATGVDPQTILADGTASPSVINVIANQSNPNTLTTGGVAEFDGIANRTIALQGSGTARAPFILININTIGASAITVAYNLRDIDGSADNAVQQVALQYRVGSTGNFTNIPAGFVPDASSGPSLATLVTPVSATLPSAADNQPMVQVRIITADAVGSDEWIGIDDINITAGAVSTNPTGIGTANPASVAVGASTVLTVQVTPGSNPASSGLDVRGDLTTIGGSGAQQFFDDGLSPDATAGDNIFSWAQAIGVAIPPGAKTLPVTITDAQARTGTASISLTTLAAPPPAVIGQLLPFFQDWTNISLITANDSWAGVPGIVGYRGDDLTTATGTDPQTILADGSSTPINVIANQTNPNTLATGGVAEFHLTNPAIALNGSGTADAPHIVISVDTTGHSGIVVSYNVRDLDGSADNAVQQVALQYRVANIGNYINVPAGFVADATEASLATRVTPVLVTLPANANNQPLIQLRIITTNAVGSDEWVGIDDILVTDEDAITKATGVGAANPNIVETGQTSRLTVTVTPGTNPPSSGLSVTMDLATIGGSSTQAFFDNATNGDQTAGDNVFTFDALVANGTTPGPKLLPGTVADAEGRSTGTSIAITVIAPPVLVAIHDIQGAGSASPFAGQPVTTTGVVTARKFNGFFLQTPDADVDANPNSSEGVFVFTSAAPPAAAAVGNSVRVSGTVQEFVPAADPFQAPLTEIIGPAVVVISTGEPLPDPAVLTALDTSPAGGLEQLERFEGMRVQVNQFLVIAPTGGNVTESSATASSDGVFYGVIPPVARPFREPGLQQSNPLPPGSPSTVTRFDENPERLRVDSDALIGAPRVNVAAGEMLGVITGPLDYGFRAYTILPEPGLPIVVDITRTPTPVAVPTANQFTVVAYNLERFFDTANDPAIGEPVLTTTAFSNRLNKASLVVRNILRTPDILAVEEIENLSTLQALAARINSDAVAAGQPNPNYVAYLVEGNDVGGIDVGFLVKSGRVAVIDVIQIGKDATYINPVDGQPDLLNDRPSLVLHAVPQSDTGASFPITVIVNHLRSLLGLEDADGRVRAKRAAQAAFLASYIQGRQNANPNERIISVGDYNAFQFSDGYVDVIGTIKGTPAPASEVVLATPDLVTPDLIDLVDTVAPDQRYSYVFDGNAQAIDHALVTANLLARVDSLQFGRVDADFPETARNDASVPTRLSDHDPLVVFFSYPPPAATQTTIVSAQNPVLFGDLVTFTAAVTAGAAPVTEGTVTFSEGSTILAGPIALTVSGHATFSTSALDVNSHVITAQYDGTGNFAASQGNMTQAVHPSLRIDDVTINEGSGGTTSATFTVTLTPPSPLTVSVQFATAGGSATPGMDFAPRLLSTLTFPAGVTTQTITVEVNSDALNEADEHFFVNLSNPVNAAILDGQAVGTIIDDDPQPNLSINDVTLVEGNAGTRTATFLVRLSAASGQTVTVDFATAGDSATSNVDFLAAGGTLTFTPGTTMQTVSVTINSDLIAETNERFFVNLSGASGAAIADGQGVGVIVNDDSVSLSIDDVTVQESSTAAVDAAFNVRLSGLSEQVITVDYYTVNGSAVAGVDYVAIPITPRSSIAFEPGQTTATIHVTVLPDHNREQPQTFVVGLARSVNAVLADASAAGTILDATAARVDAFAPASGAPGTQVVISGANLDNAVTVRFNGHPAHFTVVSPDRIIGTVPKGATTGPISVQVPAAGMAVSGELFQVVR